MKASCGKHKKQRGPVRTSKAAAEGRWATTMRFWAGPAVLIVDLRRHRNYADMRFDSIKDRASAASFYA
jgi:hypothetical protein